MSDKWIKCIAQAGNIVATSITAPQLVDDARQRHGLGAAQTIALGEALMAGLLLASTCKKGERVSLSIKGDRFLRQAMVDAMPSGTVRGFITSRSSAKGDSDEKMGPWQHGTLSIVRLKSGAPEPYTGTVPNITGYLAKDLTFYLTQSEQIPSAVGLAVNVDEDGKVSTAGAFLVQVMPGASNGEIQSIEDNIHNIGRLAARLDHDSDPTRLLAQIFNDLSFSILDEKPLLFECSCSKRKVSRALTLLGKDELKDMLKNEGGAVIHCDFCGKRFSLDESELKQLIGSL